MMLSRIPFSESGRSIYIVKGKRLKKLPEAIRNTIDNFHLSNVSFTKEISGQGIP